MEKEKRRFVSDLILSLLQEAEEIANALLKDQIFTEEEDFELSEFQHWSRKLHMAILNLILQRFLPRIPEEDKIEMTILFKTNMETFLQEEFGIEIPSCQDTVLTKEAIDKEMQRRLNEATFSTKEKRKEDWLTLYIVSSLWITLESIGKYLLIKEHGSTNISGISGMKGNLIS
ncbi:MAG: hypothetical protein SWO11_06735 [Thermodesulfobacteriota bacterium]|nr:hypothetical protein [Thermodesulfobacteriota bacterium]